MTGTRSFLSSFVQRSSTSSFCNSRTVKGNRTFIFAYFSWFLLDQQIPSLNSFGLFERKSSWSIFPVHVFLAKTLENILRMKRLPSMSLINDFAILLINYSDNFVCFILVSAEIREVLQYISCNIRFGKLRNRWSPSSFTVMLKWLYYDIWECLTKFSNTHLICIKDNLTFGDPFKISVNRIL